MKFTTMTYLTLAMAGIMFLCFAVSLFLTFKQKETPIVITRGLYIAGIIATICNMIRIIPMYEGNLGTMIFANAVVLICLIYSYVRMEMVRKNPELDEIHDDEE